MHGLYERGIYFFSGVIAMYCRGYSVHRDELPVVEVYRAAVKEVCIGGTRFVITGIHHVHLPAAVFTSNLKKKSILKNGKTPRFSSQCCIPGRAHGGWRIEFLLFISHAIHYPTRRCLFCTILFIPSFMPSTELLTSLCKGEMMTSPSSSLHV